MSPLPLNAAYMLPRKVLLGAGTRREVGVECRRLGERVILVQGSRTLMRSGAVAEVKAFIEQQGLTCTVLVAPSHEPTIDDIDTLAAAIRALPERRGWVVVGLGGGSTLDVAKAIAALGPQTQVHSVRDYLEGIGTGAKLLTTPWPVVAIPTTAGTGSEATRNAVISCPEPPCKKSLRHEQLMPQVVMLDPEWQRELPPHITAQSGMDAIVQCVEAALSHRATPFTQAMAERGFEMACEALPQAYRDGHDLNARQSMAEAAFFSGVALANGGLGIAHGLAAIIGALTPTPHGLACAVCLPIAIEVNRTAARDKLARLGRLLQPGVTSELEAVALLEQSLAELQRALGLPHRLRDLGLTREQLPLVVAGSHGNSRQGNPVAIDDVDLARVLEAFW